MLEVERDQELVADVQKHDPVLENELFRILLM
jgi:hypothetical protein